MICGANSRSREFGFDQSAAFGGQIVDVVDPGEFAAVGAGEGEAVLRIGDGEGADGDDAFVARAGGFDQHEAAEGVALQAEIGGGGDSILHILMCAPLRGLRVAAKRLNSDALGEFHLGFVEAGVGAGFAQQVGVFADFDDLAALDDDQAIGAAQRAQAVGDGDGGAAVDQVFQGRLDFALGFGVDRGGGFVEDQDARVDQQGAGDGDALAFAAGEGLAALADQRIVAVGQSQDEFVGAGGAGGGDDFAARVASGRP